MPLEGSCDPGQGYTHTELVGAVSEGSSIKAVVEEEVEATFATVVVVWLTEGCCVGFCVVDVHAEPNTAIQIRTQHKTFDGITTVLSSNFKN